MIVEQTAADVMSTAVSSWFEKTWDLRAPAPTPSHLRATVAIKGSFRGAEF